MKKNILLFVTILVSGYAIIIFGSQSSNSDAIKTFEQNTKTMDILFESYAKESVDYSQFADEVIFKGTTVGSNDSLNLSEIKAIHQDFFSKYDVKYLAPKQYLTGVNADTGQTDGSVRMYYDMEVTLSATDSTDAKSVVVPIYESFDFNEQGKAIYVQWYCDWTGHLAYLDK